MTTQFRDATPQDSADIARVCCLAGGGAFEFLYNDLQRDHSAETILAALSALQSTPYSYRRFIVAESDGEFAGAANAISLPNLIATEKNVLPALRNNLGLGRTSVVRAVVRRIRLGLRIRGRQLDSDTIILANIAVFPKHTGKGIGASLVQHVLDEASTGGYPSVSLVVWDSNMRARTLYKRMGFALVDTAPFKPLPSMPYQARCLMVAQLANN